MNFVEEMSAPEKNIWEFWGEDLVESQCPLWQQLLHVIRSLPWPDFVPLVCFAVGQKRKAVGFQEVLNGSQFWKPLRWDFFIIRNASVWWGYGNGGTIMLPLSSSLSQDHSKSRTNTESSDNESTVKRKPLFCIYLQETSSPIPRMYAMLLHIEKYYKEVVDSHCVKSNSWRLASFRQCRDAAEAGLTFRAFGWWPRSHVCQLVELRRPEVL